MLAPRNILKRGRTEGSGGRIGRLSFDESDREGRREGNLKDNSRMEWNGMDAPAATLTRLTAVAVTRLNTLGSHPSKGGDDGGGGDAAPFQ